MPRNIITLADKATPEYRTCRAYEVVVGNQTSRGRRCAIYRAAGLGARPVRVWPHRSTPGAINRAATTACPPLCLQLFHDSVGKIGIDQLYQATSKGKRRVKQAEQAKAFPGQHNACRETQQVRLYYT